MVLWRISPFHDLNGEGGMLFSGRWHTIGVPVVYLADSPASALLEICAHTSSENLPPTFTLLKVSAPDAFVEEIAPAALPANWIDELTLTRQLGTEWLMSLSSSLLRVPSVLVPETWNYLLNPLHPEAALFQIERAYQYPFDLRLKK